MNQNPDQVPHGMPQASGPQGAKSGRWARRAAWVLGLSFMTLLCSALAVRLYLTPERLTQEVRQQLMDRFAGRVTVAAVRWQLPLTVAVQGVGIEWEKVGPEATVNEAAVTVQLLALLRGHIRLGPVHVKKASIVLRPVSPDDPNTYALVAALAPRRAAAPSPEAPEPATLNWPIEVTDLTLAGVDVHIEQPSQQIDILGLHAENTDVTAQLTEQTFGATGSLGATQIRVAQPAVGRRIVVAPLSLNFNNVRACLQPGHMQLHAETLELQTPGLDVIVSGTWRQPPSELTPPNAVLPAVTPALTPLGARTGTGALTGTGTPTATLTMPLSPPSLTQHVAMTIDWAAALWPQLLGQNLWAQLQPRGQAHLIVDARSNTQRQSAVWSLQGTELVVAGVPLQQGGGALAWQAPELTLGGWRLEVPGGALGLDGKVQLNVAGGLVQAHALALKAEHLPIRTLLTGLIPAMAARAPQSVSAQVTLAGGGLWPATQTQYALDMQALGLASAGLAVMPEAVALEAAGSLTQQQTNVSHLTVRADGATLAASGQLDWVGEPTFTLRATLIDDTPEQTLTRINPLVHLARLTADLQLSGTVRQPQGQAHVSLQGLQTNPEPRSRLNVTLPCSLRHGIVRIDNLQIEGPAAHAVATLQAVVQTPAGAYLATPKLDGEVHIRRAELPAFAPQARIGGQANLALRIWGSTVAPHLAGELHIAALQLGSLAFVQANTQIFSDGRHMGLRHIALVPRAGGQMLGEVRFDRRSGQASARLQAQDVPAQWLGLKTPTPALLQASLQINGDHNDLTAHLEAQAGRVFVLSAEARVQPPAQTLALSLRGAGQLAAVSEWHEAAQNLHGNLKVQVQADGNWHAPTVDATITGDGLARGRQALGNGRLQLQAHTQAPGQYLLELDAMNLAVGQAQVSLAPNLQMTAEAHFDRLQASALLPESTDASADATATGAVRLAYQSSSSGKPPRFRADLTLNDLRAAAGTGAGAQQLVLTQPTQLTATQDALEMQPLHLSGSAGSIELRGRVVGPWLAGTPQSAAQTHLEAMGTGKVDLGFVAALLPAMGHASGQAVWAGDLSGTQAKPQGSGTLRVADEWVLRPRGSIVEIHIATGDIALSSSRLQLHDIRGTLQNGTFALGGHIDLLHFKPSHYQIQFTAHDLPVHTPDLMLEANINAQAEGDGFLPLLKGRINVTRGRFLKKLAFKDFNFVAKEPDTSTPLTESAPWLDELHLDLLATSSDGVDIRFDAGAFAADASLQTDLHITGSALKPYVVGRIAADRGSLHFPKATLQLTQAVIDFEPTPKDHLGAALNLQADGEVTSTGAGGTAAQTYNVALRVDGPLKELTFELSSDQGLGKIEILSLLTTGHTSFAELTGGQGDEGSQLDAALAFAGSQVSGPLTQLAERQLERALNLRLELGAEVTQENVRLTAAKNLNRRLRLEGAYTHGIAADQAIVSTRAQLSLTDRLLLEGTAARDLSSTTATSGANGVQSNLELKFRMMGH